MKSPSEKPSARRGKKRVYQSRPIAIPQAELPEPPVLPDVYTTDRRSMHPTRKQQQPRTPSEKAEDEQK